jgi:hypothetical protein
MPPQQLTKSNVVTGKDVEDDSLEMRSRGKNSGTDADMQDMRMLGKTQQLNVSTVTLALWIKQLTWDSAIFASSRPSASPVL